MRWKLNTIDTAGNFILIIISGLILPLILMPIVKIVDYSEIIEEIAKALVVFFLIIKLPGLKQKIWLGILFGFFFGLSESIFYLNNIFQLGDLGVFWQRFLLTVPMHVMTVLVVLWFGLKNKKWIILGMMIAIIFHLTFNMILGNIAAQTLFFLLSYLC
ncbi:PrsW family intramembrane metalloprotease [Patescibacteria group bacterium]|nr:PrsW family intramembrane metalloprotease [Patescibacteria group bacterium]MBU1921733.1 PrsW family intramembrane metalloprotease [Patescibacteria group bacterium]